MESYTEFMNWKIHHYWHLLFTNLFTYPLNLSDNHNEIFFCKNWGLILKFIWKYKSPIIAKIIVEKNKFERAILSDLDSF